jgi:hypothetical protein
MLTLFITWMQGAVRFRRIARLGLAVGLLSHCATDHRSFYPGGTSQLPIQPGAAPLAVIEFDERGDYWDPGQITRADKMIRSKSAPILLTYVHGWRHDARPGDQDLVAFQNFLNQLNEGLNQKVCGVFIGWRGASVQEKGAKGLISQPAALLSFWSRKKITDQMAGVPFANTLWRLAATSKSKNGQSILIGHSFGGRIVERALGSTAIAQMNNRKPMPYNLTFLVNPATESLYARQLKLALRKWDSEQPAIVALAAKDDSATGTAWPLALDLPGGIRHRDYVLNGKTQESQKSYVTKTVGNDQRQWTHRVRIGETVSANPMENVTALNVKGSSGDFFKIRLRGGMEGQVAVCNLEEIKEVDAPHQIESDAYWVIPLEKTILSGHGGVTSENGIFCPSMSDLMAGIIHRVGAAQNTAPVPALADPGQTEKSGAPQPSKFPNLFPAL